MNMIHDKNVSGVVLEHDIVNDSYVAHFDCPHCGAIKSVYKIEGNLLRCVVCEKRTTTQKIITFMKELYNVNVSF